MKLLPIKQLLACLLGFFTLLGCRTDTNTTATSSNANIVEPELITVRLRANPDYLCPYQTFKAWSNTILEYSYQRLLDRDKTTLELIPTLVKEVPTPELITEGALKGGYKVTYEILDEAVWDDGSPITGNDYLTTLKFIFNPAGTRYLPAFKDFMSYYSDIIVDESNPKKFTIYTSRPYYKLLDDSGFYVLPAYAYDSKGVLEDFKFSDFTNAEKSEELKTNAALKSIDSLFASNYTTQEVDQMIGSGPYKITEWNQNVDVTVTKKENWWGEKFVTQRPEFVANAKSIRFEIIPDETAGIAKLKTGELDMIGTISGNAFEDLRKNELVSKNYDMYTPETVSINYLGINCKRPKFSDARVRKALSCLIDRASIVGDVYQGHAQELYSPMPLKYDYAYEDKTYAFNVEKARQLLSEAGWADTNGNGTIDKVIDGKLTEMVISFLSTPSNVTVEQMLLVMQDDFKKAGIGIEHVTMEARQIVAARKKGEFDIFTSAAAFQGDHYGIYQFWHTESRLNYFGAGNAALDKKIDKIIETVDEAELKRLFIDFQKDLNEEQYLVFLTSPYERILINKRLKNHKVTVLRPCYLANYPYL